MKECIHRALLLQGPARCPKADSGQSSRGKRCRGLRTQRACSLAQGRAGLTATEQKALWAAGVREATKGVEGERQTQRLWTPTLDPPAALAWLSVVLVGVKRPYSAGSVARASNCFECEDLRLVQPQCQPASERSAKRAAKGAQYILHRALPYQSLAEALQDAHYSVAFSRWDT
ncbi:hypothetical protein WJX84_000702, partial [Apatococcus fuscideae]